MLFGCWDITKTCTCSLPVLLEQGCASNEECAALGATCRFIDSDLEPSIGFTQCATCQTRRFCLLTSGRANGFCACGLVDIDLQRCVQHGQVVMPGYDNLCLYTQDYNFLARTDFMVSFYTSLTTPCGQLNPSSTFCAKETSDGTLYVVGVDSVRRRRLLGAPASAGSAMTADDTHNSLCKDALSTNMMPAHQSACRAAYEYSGETLDLLDLPWRFPACTFCSLEDAVHALLLQPQNLFVLATNVSRALHVLARHSPLHAVSVCVQRAQKHVQTALRIASVEPAVEVSVVNHSWHVEVLVDNPSVQFLAQVLHVLLYPFPPRTNHSTRPHAASRRLLSFDDVAAAVQQNFRVSATLRQAFATQFLSSLDYVSVSKTAQKEWTQSWPPIIGAVVLDHNACPPLTNLLRSTRSALTTVDSAYTMQKQSTPRGSLSKAWVNISRRNDTDLSWTDYTALRASQDPLNAAVLLASSWLLALVNVSPNYIFDALAAVAEELWHLVKCDYEAVQTCSKWRVHILLAGIVVAVYYLGFYLVFSAVGLSLPVTLSAVFLPSVVLYYSYGYAPTCFPAVPVCLYDDLVHTAGVLVPKSIRLPPVMYRSQDCLAAATVSVDARCLRTCTDEPFAYADWYDVLSWWCLEVGLDGALLRIVDLPITSTVIGEQMQGDIQAAVAFHARVFATPDDTLINSNRICAFISLYKLIPYLALSFFCVMLAFAGIQALLLTVLVALQLAFSLFVSAFY
jgi:hypothetical protein